MVCLPMLRPLRLVTTSTSAPVAFPSASRTGTMVRLTRSPLVPCTVKACMNARFMTPPASLHWSATKLTVTSPAMKSPVSR